MEKGEKIIGVGLGRTGTKSLTVALSKLGYNIKHYPQNPLDDIYDYDGLTDSPTIPYIKEFLFNFPNSKFICTTRDIDSWLESWEKHSQNIIKIYNNQLPKFIITLRTKLFGQVDFDKIVWKKAYNNHINMLKAEFSSKPTQILFFDIFKGDGYDELCEFLNKPKIDDNFPKFIEKKV